nr:MAG TPA: hypothetical protein [Caudoviricetes sp.]
MVVCYPRDSNPKDSSPKHKYHKPIHISSYTEGMCMDI